MIADRIAGGLLLLLAAAYFLLAQSIQEVNITSAIGPRVFPELLAVAMGILGVLLFIVRDKAHEAWNRTEVKDMVVTVLALVAYALLVTPLGYPIATFLFLGGTLAYLIPDHTPRHWIISIAVAAGFSLFTYHLFADGLGIVLPHGPYPF